VDDLFAHIDWRTKRLERNAHDINGPDHTGAKAPGLQKQKSFLILTHSYACS
jgi:hypothetical protein